MVDEQFSLQRKILKGQVDVRNEETSICTRSEQNKKQSNSRIILLFLLITWKISLSTSQQGQTTGCTWADFQVEIKFISSVFMWLHTFSG